MLHHFKILPETMSTVLPATIMVVSVISYSNKNTKTDENYYVGFPAIWNVVVLYLVILDCSVLVNTAILIFLIVLKIIPIRFVHPFRTKSFKKSTLVVSLSWFIFALLTVIFREYSYLSDYYQYFNHYRITSFDWVTFSIVKFRGFFYGLYGSNIWNHE